MPTPSGERGREPALPPPFSDAVIRILRLLPTVYQRAGAPSDGSVRLSCALGLAKISAPRIQAKNPQLFRVPIGTIRAGMYTM